MKRGTGIIVAAALVAVFCMGAGWRTTAVAASPTVFAAADAEFRIAQSFRRNRDLRGRQRFIQPFRATPPRRDSDRFLRERRERNRTGKTDQERATEGVRRGEVLPLGAIIGTVQRYCSGQFLDATLRERGNSFAYRVTILRPSGRRVSLLVDAQSGAVLRGRCN